MASVPGTKPRTTPEKPTTDETPNKPVEATKPTGEPKTGAAHAEPASGETSAETVKDVDTKLVFQDVEDLPSGELDNPFQEKVNELAQTGKATQFVYPAENSEWAIGKIRRAVANIDKGVRTKVRKVPGDDTKVIITFKVVTKMKKKRD